MLEVSRKKPAEQLATIIATRALLAGSVKQRHEIW